jgi:uncharacterized membrane protein
VFALLAFLGQYGGGGSGGGASGGGGFSTTYWVVVGIVAAIVVLAIVLGVRWWRVRNARTAESRQSERPEGAA